MLAHLNRRLTLKPSGYNGIAGLETKVFNVSVHPQTLESQCKALNLTTDDISTSERDAIIDDLIGTASHSLMDAGIVYDIKPTEIMLLDTDEFGGAPDLQFAGMKFWRLPHAS